MPSCYPERIAQQACEQLEARSKRARALAAGVRKESGELAACEALQEIFPDAIGRFSEPLYASCRRETEGALKMLKEELAAVPRCCLVEVDVCFGRARARCGNVDLPFVIGEPLPLEQPD